MKVTPYLLFDGQCLQALQFYQSVFGGELNYTLVADSPVAAMFSPAQQQRVLNGRLQSSLLDLSASDWLHPTEQPQRGNMLSLCLMDGAVPDTEQRFRLLSEHGVMTEAFAEQPFGWYGAFTDRFGVRWMMHAWPEPRR